MNTNSIVVAVDGALDGQGALAVVHVDFAAQGGAGLLERDGPGLLAGLRVEIDPPDAADVGLRVNAGAGESRRPARGR